MVNVRMVTGDHFETARYVAYKAGIISKTEMHGKDVVMTGEQFRTRIGVLEKADGSKIPNYTIDPKDNKVTFEDIAKF
jgi:hypothetical protein